MAFPARQNLFDWITQWWNILLGRRVHESKDAWLTGPIGLCGETSDAFIERISLEGNYVVQRNQTGAGLVESVHGWGDHLNPRVADFYLRTGAFDFHASSQWNPLFGSFGWLVGKMFSHRIQQLNLPRTSTKTPVEIKSEIIKLVNREGTRAHTIWRRSQKQTGEAVFYGIYSICVIPSGESCIKVTFPLPHGSATVILSIHVDSSGNLELASSGNTYGDPGFYFIVQDSTGGLWKHYLPTFREKIRVFVDKDDSLIAEHSMSLWSLKVFSMRYRIMEKQIETASES